MTDTPDYRSTVFLPKTAFPMKAGLAEAEPKWLAKWKADGLYQRLREARAGADKFVLHDGPPYANGDLHMGHTLNKVLKDLVVRTQSLLGKDAPYRPGWDCHGLPIEWKVEEQYRKAKRAKDDVPAAEFRAECRAFAAHWVDRQRTQFERLGVQGDWSNPYLTMDFAAEAAIVAELLTFAETGQLFRGAKPVMWSPVEKTALAEAEVEYEEITSTQIDVAFEIVEAPNAPELVGAHAVIWTTTPWTIPVNQAIGYGTQVDYVYFNYIATRFAATDGVALLGREVKLLVAEDLLPAFLKRLREFPESYRPESLTALGFSQEDVVSRLPGSALAGAIARHPMHHLGGFFARPRPFLPGEFVTTDQGTGLVHMAPDHGEDDFALCKAHGLDPVFAVEPDGRYRADWPWLGGEGSVIAPKFNAPDGPICRDLAAAGALLAASQDYRHSYPHSWRSKAKLIYRATPQWFIAMDKDLPDLPWDSRGGEDSAYPTNPEVDTLRSSALRAIRHTRFVPERGRNRLNAMVADRPDWLISRQRAWGVPITLFVHRQTGDYLRDPDVNARIVAAVHENGADAWVQADAQQLLGNAYSADDYEQVHDILDVWFDSGSTHAFVLGGEQADLYLEGSDQHRGWFQSSLLEACGTRGRAPYKAVMTHGFVLDAEGKKMSKSVGNVTDPLEVMKTSGADILRLWVAQSGYFDDVRIGKEQLAGTSEAYRKLRNTLRYLLGALDGWSEAERVSSADMPELERWVLHRLAELDAELREAVNDFDFTAYMAAISAFANSDLSAFYFDVRKDSLYCDAPSSAKRRACRTVLDTLFHALVRWLAPVLVFTAEEAWAERFPDAESVHLLTWSKVDAAWLAKELGAKWEAIRLARGAATEAIERLRRDKMIGSSLEADVELSAPVAILEAVRSVAFDEVAIIASLRVTSVEGVAYASVTKTNASKCARCWRHRPEVGTQPDPNLCDRCYSVVGTSVLERAAA